MDKFRNKYRIPSARAPFWDYSQDGWYFITICTIHRECILGKIIHGKMILSPIGEIVLKEWDKSFVIRKELICDKYVIMPNHLHAILGIENGIGVHVETYGRTSLDNNIPLHDDIETHGRASLPPPHLGVAYRSPKSISSFVGGFKSSATIQINEMRKTPKMDVWQSRFHDHIIRNEEEFQKIRKYIETNPENWDNDVFFNDQNL